MKGISKILIPIAVSIQTLFVFGQESPYKHWSVKGYLDTYYAYDFSQPNRIRDYVVQTSHHNAFQINLAMLLFEMENEKIRGRLFLQEGTYPQSNYAGTDFSYRFFNQAFVGVKLGKNTWLDVGVMPGHFGYESSMSFDNFLLSQAMVTDYTPYYQSGIQLTHYISDNIAFKGVIVNGWQLINENNKYKSGGISLEWQMEPSTKLSYGNYFGKDPVGNQDLIRFHQNFVFSKKWSSWDFISSLDLLWNDPYGGNESLIWFITAVASRSFNTWQTSLRYEFVQDENEVLIIGPTYRWQSHIGTFCIARMISASTKAKLEIRHFTGNETVWKYKNDLRTTNQVVSMSIAFRL